MMADTTPRAVAPLVVAHLIDGTLGYFHAGEPLMGVSDEEIKRLTDKGAIAKPTEVVKALQAQPVEADVVADDNEVVKTTVRRTTK